MKPCPDAITAFKELIEKYQWTHDKAPEMIRMFAADRKDFRKVLSFYRKGKWLEAQEYARGMDTVAREHIPQKIWDDIQSA